MSLIAVMVIINMPDKQIKKKKEECYLKQPTLGYAKVTT